MCRFDNVPISLWEGGFINAIIEKLFSFINDVNTNRSSFGWFFCIYYAVTF
jgi:hypothetical protein